MKKQTVLLAVFVAMVFFVLSAANGAQGNKAESVALTPAGEKLMADYSNQLNTVKAEIEKVLPGIDEQKKSAYLKALEVEKAAEAGVAAANKNLAKVGAGHALVGHAKGKWIGGADAGIAKAKDLLKAAKTQAERDAANKELVGWQKNRQDGVDALNERQALLDDALRQQPQWLKDLEAAENKLDIAKANSMKASDALGFVKFLKGKKNDANLAKYQVLAEATPKGLALFAQQGKAQQALIEKLLNNKKLMIQMAVAGGAKNGNYGQAMKIYTDIRKASKKAKKGVLQRFAVGVSLEHATPIKQQSAAAKTDAPEFINPVGRYMQYEKAYLGGELDPGFKDLSEWDYRMVVNGNEPDDGIVWGRKMLHNYRPDHITTKDYRWRYVAAVSTDVRYGSQCNKYDKPELQFFQNILMNGGVCGRRAFFGRFILRAFGIPTAARPQRGHATLVHWTPDGWVICFGAGWGVGWVNGPESIARGKSNVDLVFLGQTQGRMTGEPFKQVWRSKTVSSVLDKDDAAGIWNTVALYRQRAIIIKAKAKTLAAVGTDIGEANETKEKVDIIKSEITQADKKITVASCGTITIPAAACSKPTKSTGKIIFMPSNLGGKQLHYSRNGEPQEFEYTFDAPKAGEYALTARVVTPSWKQTLTVKANAGNAVDIALPFTVGMWDKTQPVKITLAKGKNVLTFSRDHEWLKGLTIRDFTLSPVN